VNSLPPLRLPRALLDPGAVALPAADAEGLVTVVLAQREGRITDLRAAEPSVDAPLALTPPVEPHAHLDKAFTFHRFPNREGTIAGALAANRRESEERQAAAVLERGERALERAWRHGMRAVRSHADGIGAAAEATWEALGTLRSRWADRVELQRVALVPIRHWSTPEGAALAARVAAGGGLLGGVLGNPYASGTEDGEAMLALLRLAERHGCGIDLHVDESDSQPGHGVGLVCRLRREHRIEVPLTCSHAASMGLLPDRPLRRLAEAMAAAGVGVVALPATNLWLLGRRPGRTPWRRPQAPIRQLQEAGVTVAVGGDNVQDPWFPGGDFDPIALLRFCLPASHLAPWLRTGLAPFTSAAARLMGLAWDGVLRPGSPADMIVLEARNWPELLAGANRRRVLRSGSWLPEEAPPPRFPFPSPSDAVGPT
jgi:cytosine deaminase